MNVMCMKKKKEGKVYDFLFLLMHTRTIPVLVWFHTVQYHTILHCMYHYSYPIVVHTALLLCMMVVFCFLFDSTVPGTRIIQNNDQFGIEHVLPQSVSSTHISTIHHKKILDQVPRMWTTPTIIFMSLFLQKQHLSLIVYSYVPINTVITTDSS